ncbi:hypothetical protein K9L67_00580 [Candidatus Woesearchaeota archaeon]|nr:hypothetical protein [Candidatus Woesearchaeota archaeon]MCF7900702.1 hypothetical protein [Candidatus Woesearchaeota archaeon]MCF8013223.1 hypothetical protein [Candidatus Woesearchaeota archaeon]
MNRKDLDYIEFKRKYKKKLAGALGDKIENSKPVTTSDYNTFKDTFMPKNLSFYEKGCGFAEKIIPMTPDKKKIPDIQEAIKISHLNISPTGTASFAALTSLAIILISIILGYLVVFSDSTGTTEITFFVFSGLILALIMFLPLSKLPFIIANIWRMKASNQMVLSIFYIVTYMRHTPNLELAIDFAAEHLNPPLSLDFKKVIWDIETGKFDSVNESLDNYLETWRRYNPEFIESTHLIQSSLYETSETRRQEALDKSLSVILDETFEKMLHYTHDLKSPITTLHMLGVILPILGLVILPLATSFIPEARWYHLFVMYNIALPVLVYYMGREILSTRPSGYGGIDLSNLRAEEKNDKIVIKLDKKKDSKNKIELTPMLASVLIFIILFTIGILPLLIHTINPGYDLVLTNEFQILNYYDLDDASEVYLRFLDYRTVDLGSGKSALIGPFGLGASILSLFIPLSIGLSIGLYNKLKTTNLMSLQERTKKLELEFASALFQLGNRLADGVPAEIAFSNVAQVMKGTQSGRFFEEVTINIVKLGMGVEEAIFNIKNGALKNYPSSIVESSMKVFLESSKKGPMIASQALITVAEYIKSMHRVDERLKDLMSDIVGSMKSQIAFLTPAISGIVVGITGMITQIMGSLTQKMADFNTGTSGALADSSSLFAMLGGGGVPTYFFQAIVGLYVVQITLILSIMINGIQNGADKLSEKDEIAKNMLKGTILYVAIAGICVITFSIIAASLIGKLSI